MSVEVHNEITAMQREIVLLRSLAGDLLALLDEMPVKHPQQADRRNALRARMRRYALDELTAESERLGLYKTA